MSGARGHQSINPESLGAPKGYSNGVLARANGRVLFVAGQIGWDGEQRIVSERFAEQFERALANVAAVVVAAGGAVEDIGRLTIYATDKSEYLAALKDVGAAYRRVMGRHYPAMALVEVRALVEPGAKVEIEATAVVPVGAGADEAGRIVVEREEVEGLRFEIEDGVGTLTLDRPDRLNSLTFAIYRRLVELFAGLEHDERVKAVIITGTGKGFCSGGDVHDIIGRLIGYSATEMSGFARMTCDVIRNMRRLRKPVIAAINGTAAGAGAAIALASDLRIASSASKIAFLFTKVGLTGADMGSAYLLPRVVGLAKASELLMLGDSVPAAEAHRIGLFNEVVAPEEVLPRARELARRLATGPTFSLGMTKELINNGLMMDLDTALDAEAKAQTICMLAEDFREFHASFVEKRKPDFRGK